jgi:hypothetical protein
MSESTFDPRFDPAFQRGFVPRLQDPRQAVVSPVTPDDAAPARVIPGRRSAERPAFAVPAASVPVEQPTAPAPVFAVAEEPPTDAAKVAPEAAPRPIRTELRNPFLWVLIVGGALLALWAWQAYFAAHAAQYDVQSSVSGPEDQGRLNTIWALMQLTPSLVTAGLLISAAGIAVLALRWRR